MPRSRSIAIQSERARRRSPRAFTSPANWIAPPNSSNFSVKVVLPASGCEMIAKVRRRAISSGRVVINRLYLLPGSGSKIGGTNYYNHSLCELLIIAASAATLQQKFPVQLKG